MRTTASSVSMAITLRKYWLLLWAAFILPGFFSLSLRAETGGKEVMTYKEAMALAKEGKSEEAIAAIRRIMHENPDSDNREAHVRLGLIYFRTQRYEEALDEFAKVTALKSDSPMAYYFTGLIYEKMAVGKTGIEQSVELKKKALAAWQSYLACARTGRARPESHKNIGISVEENIKRAQKHVELLNEELLDAKK